MTPRRPMLKIVDRYDAQQTETDSGHVQHDSRGNAVWSAAIDLEATLELELLAEPRPAVANDGDPYNRDPSRRHLHKLR